MPFSKEETPNGVVFTWRRSTAIWGCIVGMLIATGGGSTLYWSTNGLREASSSQMNLFIACVIVLIGAPFLLYGYAMVEQQIGVFADRIELRWRSARRIRRLEWKKLTNIVVPSSGDPIIIFISRDRQTAWYVDGDGIWSGDNGRAQVVESIRKFAPQLFDGEVETEWSQYANTYKSPKGYRSRPMNDPELEVGSDRP